MSFHLLTLSTAPWNRLNHPVNLKLTKAQQRQAYRLAAIILAAILGIFLALNILFTLLQATILPPFMRVGTLNIGLRSPAEAKAMLTEYGMQQDLQLSVQGQLIQTPAYQAGVVLDVDKILHEVTEQSGWQRLPLVAAIQSRSDEQPFFYRVNKQQLGATLNSDIMPKRTEAVDASIALPVKPGELAVINPEQIGSRLHVDEAVVHIETAIKRSGNLEVELIMEQIQPKITSAQLAGRVEKINALLASRVTIQNDAGRSYMLTTEDMHTIVVLNTDSEGLPAGAIDRAKLVGVLQQQSGRFYQAPTTQSVTLRDGQQVASSGGAAGRALDVQSTATTILAALEKGDKTVTASMASVKAPINYNKSFSPTSAGLLAFLQDFDTIHGGSFGVAIRELNGDRSASHNANVAMGAASIYKIFLSYAALKQVEEGKLSMDTQTSSGSVQNCIQRMIVVSDNPCGHALLSHIGYSEVNNIVHAAGFTRTNVSGSNTTTAADTASLMAGLYNHSLLSATNSDYLIALMKQQKYRNGIPAGSSGSSVANKVGFLGGINNDAAIVYGPKSDYVLVVLTKGSSFATIKSLASGLYGLLAQ